MVEIQWDKLPVSVWTYEVRKATSSEAARYIHVGHMLMVRAYKDQWGLWREKEPALQTVGLAAVDETIADIDRFEAAIDAARTVPRTCTCSAGVTAVDCHEHGGSL